MRKLLGFIVALCVVLSTVFAFAADRVKYCYDGDTFVLQSGEKVRLAAIDTPEVGHKGERDQFHAQKSRQMLMDLVQGKKVRIEPLGSKSYGRTVAEVFLPDGRSVNEIMLREGGAFFYYHKDTPKNLMRKFMKAQSLAIKEKKGMWAGVLKKTGHKQFIGNRNSKRLFTQDCKELRSVSPRNYVRFDTIAEAFEAGFAPVRACNIWPLD